MKYCTIDDVLSKVDSKGRVKLYTDGQGMRKYKQGDSFYVWTKQRLGDTCLLVFEKDLSVDGRGRVYVVDGCDVLRIF
ncbi:hypothetical protein ABE137_12070 [Brevibacillus laterosporus]|uniref:hypothetical protein n=1 Tax=Brevibacillus phage Sundance TaxID=1691958 RepID=UPI0006BC3D24|nr:hypothetical protein AVT09_gp083 [Brevibacillus phage Sundance]ALA47899.1 hypothetical protein SUNDANCE_83 [Brevibacillus phage Sundance]